MSRRDRCGETHIRDIDSNKLRVRDCVAEIDGELHPMAVHARDGVTSGALAALAESGTSDVLVRVRVGDHYADTVVDVSSLHRRQRSVGASDPDLVKMSLLEEVSGHSINQRAVAVATQRLRATLSPGEIKNFIDEAAPVLSQVVARQPHALDVLRESLGAQEYLERVFFGPEPRRSSLVYEAPAFSLVPQANKIANVSAVVDAIADGCYSSSAIGEAVGMSGRQGDYYPHAAHTLGLVERVQGIEGAEWQLTVTGAAFVGLDAGGRVDYLVDALDEIDWITTYVNEGPDTLRTDWAAEQDLNETTIDRRLATINSWVGFKNTARAQQVTLIADAMTGTRERAPGVVQRVQAAAQARMKRNKALDDRRCPRCHVTVAPAVHECENCGTAIG